MFVSLVEMDQHDARTNVPNGKCRGGDHLRGVLEFRRLAGLSCRFCSGFIPEVRLLDTGRSDCIGTGIPLLVNGLDGLPLSFGGAAVCAKAAADHRTAALRTVRR